MEVFAAFGEHTDHEIGRVVKAIEDMGELDNTLIVYIVGDNGASAEGGMAGMFNEMTYFNGVHEPCGRVARASTWGGPRPIRTWPRGWAVAGNTPVHVDQAGRVELRRHAKPLVVRWPKGITSEGRDAQPVPPRDRHRPDRARGRGPAGAEGRTASTQTPMEGVSLAYTFDDAEGEGPASHAVLRDRRQPRHLPRWLVRRHDPPGAVGESRAGRSRTTCGSSTTRGATSAW